MPGLNISGATGDTLAADGSNPLPKQGRFGELVASQLRGRWYEHNIRGRLFSGGMALTSISAATFSAATLGATATPIAGIWNPANSGVNAEIELAQLSVIITALQQTGPGGFGWYSSAGNNTQPATGSKGISRLSLTATGKCQNMAGVALTGLSNNLAFVAASALVGGSASNLATLQTAAGLQPTQAGVSEEHLEGSFILQPGTVLALLCNGTPVAHSAWAGILWAEVPTS
jgi:hypothetical protein